MQAAACELVGAAASYGYLWWLMSDVDRLQPGDRIPLNEAEAIQQPLLRSVARVGGQGRDGAAGLLGCMEGAGDDRQSWQGLSGRLLLVCPLWPSQQRGCSA